MSLNKDVLNLIFKERYKNLPAELPFEDFKKIVKENFVNKDFLGAVIELINNNSMIILDEPKIADLEFLEKINKIYPIKSLGFKSAGDEYLNKIVDSFPNLQHIKLKSVIRFDTIDCSFFSKLNLKSLIIDASQELCLVKNINAISKNIKKLVMSCSVVGEDLSTDKFYLQNFPNLKTLEFYDDGEIEISSIFGSYEKLENFKVTCQNIDKIKHWIDTVKKFEKLNELNLVCTNFLTSKLSNLFNLYEELPINIKKLSLKGITLKEDIKKLIKPLNIFKNLESLSLDLYDNVELKSLNLENLKELKISYKNIGQKTIGLSELNHCGKLEKLSLNNIPIFSRENELPYLKVLEFNNLKNIEINNFYIQADFQGQENYYLATDHVIKFLISLNIMKHSLNYKLTSFYTKYFKGHGGEVKEYLKYEVFNQLIDKTYYFVKACVKENKFNTVKELEDYWTKNFLKKLTEEFNKFGLCKSASDFNLDSSLIAYAKSFLISLMIKEGIIKNIDDSSLKTNKSNECVQKIAEIFEFERNHNAPRKRAGDPEIEAEHKAKKVKFGNEFI